MHSEGGMWEYVKGVHAAVKLYDEGWPGPWAWVMKTRPQIIKKNCKKKHMSTITQECLIVHVLNPWACPSNTLSVNLPTSILQCALV